MTTKATPLSGKEFDLIKLRRAVRDFLNEYDNPIQDLTMKRIVLQKLRELVMEP